MAGQEEPKKAVPGKAPAPIKLHTAAGAAPRIVPQGAAPAAARTGNDDKTMRLKKQAPPVLKLTPQAESADAPAAAAPAPTPAAPKQTVRLVPMSGEQKTSTRRVPKVDSAAPAAAAAPAPAPAPVPGATAVKLKPQTAASAPTIKLTPQTTASAAASAATIKLTPQAAASAGASPTVKLSRTGAASAAPAPQPKAAPSAPTVKLTPQAAASAATIKLTPQPQASASAATIKLTPQAPSSAATIKLTPQPAAGGASQTIKLSDAKAPAAGGTEADVENVHTVKISRAPRTAPPMPAPASSAKPPSAIPGAKQTIKLRPSSMSSGISAAPAPASAPVQMNAGQANRTIKLVPVGNGGAQIAPASGAAPAAPVPGTSPAAQTVKLTAAAPASAPAAEQPSDAATVKLKSGSTGKTTLKLSLQKPSGTQTAVAENGQLKVPELTLPGKGETAEKPSVVFLLISIAAMLAVVFTVLLMSVQFANMYHGANVNIPGMTRLSGTR